MKALKVEIGDVVEVALRIRQSEIAYATEGQILAISSCNFNTANFRSRYSPFVFLFNFRIIETLFKMHRLTEFIE